MTLIIRLSFQFKNLFFMSVRMNSYKNFFCKQIQYSVLSKFRRPLRGQNFSLFYNNHYILSVNHAARGDKTWIFQTRSLRAASLHLEFNDNYKKRRKNCPRRGRRNFDTTQYWICLQKNLLYVFTLHYMKNRFVSWQVSLTLNSVWPQSQSDLEVSLVFENTLDHVANKLISESSCFFIGNGSEF